MGGARKKARLPSKLPEALYPAVSKPVVDEIDEIFSKRKKSGPQQQPSDVSPSPSGRKRQSDERLSADDAAQSKDPKKNKTKKKRKMAAGEEALEVGGGKPNPKPRRKTEDGLTIYAEEELGWNKKNAGGTPLCPFDCNCCF